MIIIQLFSRQALVWILSIGLMGSASAATLANWDFEGGDLSASEQGNFIATSIEVLNGNPVAFAAGSGIGGGGALEYVIDPTQTADINNVVFFKIENTHPTDSIQLDLVTLSFSGQGGDISTIYFRRNMGFVGDIDDGVESIDPWTSFTFPPFPNSLPAGESISVGWANVDFQPSPLTHYLDNIVITGTEPIPEPSAVFLLLAGLAAGCLRRRS